VRARPQLVGHLREADDRPRHQLREHRDVAREVDETADRRRAAAVDVPGVAHRLERVEADAERQRDAEREVEPQGVQTDGSAIASRFSTPKLKYLKKPSSAEVRADRDGQGQTRPREGGAAPRNSIGRISAPRKFDRAGAPVLPRDASPQK
jgi:hypothetical protein